MKITAATAYNTYIRTDFDRLHHTLQQIRPVSKQDQ